MPKPILVGLDPERGDVAPLVLGAGLARITGAPLMVAASYLHDTITNAVSAGMVEEDLHNDALAKLEALTSGTDADLLVAGGSSPARVLDDLAARLDASIVVVGSTTRGALGRVTAGSTAERLLHGAPSPVAVAPAGLDAEWRPRRIGAAFLDLEEAYVALRAAADLARAAGATLHATTAVEPLEWRRSAVVPPYHEEGMLDTANAQRSLDDATAKLPAGVEVTNEVVVARPADALAALSSDVDLLVCGSRGYGPLRSVLLGGVTHQLIKKSNCPLLVVPRGIAEPFGELAERREAAAG